MEQLAFLMDAAHFPINPITTGSLFPDEQTAWSRDGDSHSLIPEQVAQVAAHLKSTPFDVLAPHVRAALTAEYRGSLNEEQSRYLSDILGWATEHLAEHYRALVVFSTPPPKTINARCSGPPDGGYFSHRAPAEGRNEPTEARSEQELRLLLILGKQSQQRLRATIQPATNRGKPQVFRLPIQIERRLRKPILYPLSYGGASAQSRDLRVDPG
ncbi:hypothetical protein ACIBJE_19885 [Micromonospora sp. NPDC050187]|uniref:hypothetical protein n=1 Tax=Micromonospora sp. NPDC050187 TaxID=3364277 RepID=UPI0037933447